MRLTVIMPMYNREALVETSLQSLLKQRDACELDILVVNDGSTDNSPEVVNRVAEKFGHIRMITTENLGVTKARNVGLENVPEDADVVTFLDSDDISPTDRLRNDLPTLEENPSLDFTYGRITLVDDLDNETLEPAQGARHATVRGIQLSAGLYRANFLRELGKFDETFEQAEDTDYLFRAFEKTHKYGLTDTVCVYYRRHPGNMTLARDVAMKSFIRAIHKSIIRRKRDPALNSPDGVFDMKQLMESPVDWVYPSEAA